MYDLIVIGGGAAGYAAALRASQLGGRVILIEQEKLGGTCLHRGCIPSKVLFQQAGVVEEYRTSLKEGLFKGEAEICLDAVGRRQAEIVARLYQGLEDLLKLRKVDVISGRALIKGPGRVLVDGTTSWEYEARSILVASGSRERTFPYASLVGVRGAEESLNLPHEPCSVAVLGGGVTGLELAGAYASFGFKVTVVEREKVLLPALQDEDMSKWLAFLFKKRGLKIYTGTAVQHLETVDDDAATGSLHLTLALAAKEQVITVNRVINAVGREPVLDVFAPGCEVVNMTTSGVSVNEHMETNIKGIYAAGDVTGPPMLAHLAYFEGITAAENAMGLESKLAARAVPSCMAARPGVAWVGLTEQQAREAGLNPRVGKFPLATCSGAVLKNKEEGFVRLITAEDGIIIGMQVLGEAAEELIMEGTLAVQHGLTLEELSNTVHPHPTLHESIWETCLSLKGLPLHG